MENSFHRRSSDFGAAASTKEVILGTESGQIFEMAVDEADKREKYVKPLFELTEQREGIKDLQVSDTVN